MLIPRCIQRIDPDGMMLINQKGLIVYDQLPAQPTPLAPGALFLTPSWILSPRAGSTGIAVVIHTGTQWDGPRGGTDIVAQLLHAPNPTQVAATWQVSMSHSLLS